MTPIQPMAEEQTMDRATIRMPSSTTVERHSLKLLPDLRSLSRRCSAANDSLRATIARWPIETSPGSFAVRSKT